MTNSLATRLFAEKSDRVRRLWRPENGAVPDGRYLSLGTAETSSAATSMAGDRKMAGATLVPGYRLLPRWGKTPRSSWPRDVTLLTLLT